MKVLVKQKRKEIHVKKSNAIAEKARIAIAQSEATHVSVVEGQEQL
jgi:hypothetical protein